MFSIQHNTCHVTSDLAQNDSPISCLYYLLVNTKGAQNVYNCVLFGFQSEGVGDESTNMTMSSEDLRLEAETRYNTTQIGRNTINEWSFNVQHGQNLDIYLHYNSLVGVSSD